MAKVLVPAFNVMQFASAAFDASDTIGAYRRKDFRGVVGNAESAALKGAGALMSIYLAPAGLVAGVAAATAYVIVGELAGEYAKANPIGVAHLHKLADRLRGRRSLSRANMEAAGPGSEVPPVRLQGV